jgi:23S rRNA pseudouridine1911/1915/1917 synthase
MVRSPPSGPLVPAGVPARDELLAVGAYARADADAEAGLDARADAAPEDAAANPWDDEPERRTAIADERQHGSRLDKVVVSMAPEFSRSHLQSLIDRGHVAVDGVTQTQSSRKVLVGQRIDVQLMPTPESMAFRPEPMSLNVVFEDAHLMVIDKPVGLVVHPAAGHWSGTLLNGLLAHHAAAATLARAGIVHRLDKDTSGLMVVGKTIPAITALVRAIAARDVRREYLALAHGTVPEAPFSVDAPLGRDPKSRVRMAVVATGRSARTDVQRVGLASFDNTVSAVVCKLHTGRTHQIRVHLASTGHPLLADTLYGGRPELGLTRQALHAYRLSFEHPATGDTLRFEAPPPEDFASAWSRVLASSAANP